MAKLMVIFRSFTKAPKTNILQQLRPKPSMSKQNSKARFHTCYLLLLSTEESRLNILFFLIPVCPARIWQAKITANFFSHFCGVKNSRELYHSLYTAQAVGWTTENIAVRFLTG